MATIIRSCNYDKNDNKVRNKIGFMYEIFGELIANSIMNAIRNSQRFDDKVIDDLVIQIFVNINPDEDSFCHQDGQESYILVRAYTETEYDPNVGSSKSILGSLSSWNDENIKELSKLVVYQFMVLANNCEEIYPNGITPHVTKHSPNDNWEWTLFTDIPKNDPDSDQEEDVELVGLIRAGVYKLREKYRPILSCRLLTSYLKLMLPLSLEHILDASNCSLDEIEERHDDIDHLDDRAAEESKPQYTEEEERDVLHIADLTSIQVGKE